MKREQVQNELRAVWQTAHGERLSDERMRCIPLAVLEEELEKAKALALENAKAVLAAAEAAAKAEVLRAHIQSRNQASLDWVAADPGNRFTTMLTPDPAHWAGYGVTTPAELDHYLLVAEAYDAVKYAYGYRPDWRAFQTMTAAELRQQIESAAAAVREQAAQEERILEWNRKAEAAERKAEAYALAAALNPKPFGLQLAAVWPQ